MSRLLYLEVAAMLGGWSGNCRCLEPDDVYVRDDEEERTDAERETDSLLASCPPEYDPTPQAQAA